MIPKILHYCWFGGKKKPRLVRRCIASWRKYAPDFDIVEWNEKNFNLDTMPFTREAYEGKNFAFVSDVARAAALLQYGGVYLDTDMELRKPLEPFLGDRFFAGFEPGAFVAAGIIGAEPGDAFFQAYLAHYETLRFFLPDGRRYADSNVPLFTRLLEERGLRRENVPQNLNGRRIYPDEVFYPYDYRLQRTRLTPNSAAVHHYSASWMPRRVRTLRLLKKMLKSLLPTALVRRITAKSKRGSLG
ncbi:MAG: glycosyl transferase [Oscillospiraceae bacterium]|jgi:hypothetical protein|nr:glycosyl transferase [Oscillospiraceae bacterium]